MDGLSIDDDAILPSSVLDSPLVEVAMVPDSRTSSLCLRSLCYQMPSLLAVAIKNTDGTSLGGTR